VVAPLGRHGLRTAGDRGESPVSLVHRLIADRWWLWEEGDRAERLSRFSLAIMTANSRGEDRVFSKTQNNHIISRHQYSLRTWSSLSPVCGFSQPPGVPALTMMAEVWKLQSKVSSQASYVGRCDKLQVKAARCQGVGDPPCHQAGSQVVPAVSPGKCEGPESTHPHTHHRGEQHRAGAPLPPVGPRT
jgi:hypothetical protein